MPQGEQVTRLCHREEFQEEKKGRGLEWERRKRGSRCYSCEAGTGEGKATGRILGWTKGSGRPGRWGVTTSMEVSG